MKPAGSSPSPATLVLLISGAIVALAGWLLPVNMRALQPVLLKEAARGTSSLAEFGSQLLESEKPGPASLVLSAANSAGDVRAPQLAAKLTAFAERQPEFIAWGGWDPFLDPLFSLKENVGRKESTPVLSFFVTERARENLRRYLANSRSPGVQALLETRAIGRTARFVPANRAGGQPLDAVILLTALLYQGDHLSPTLQREIKGLAGDCIRTNDLAALENFYMDLLALGKRLNWVQLSEFLRHTNSTQTVGEFAHLSRVAPDKLPLIYAAALFSNSADSVASYLLRYGKAGAEDLATAAGFGQGAVQLLVIRQVPINRTSNVMPGFGTTLALLHPKATLFAKYLFYLLGAYLLFRGLDRWVMAPFRSVIASAQGSRTVLRLKSGAVALVSAFLFIISTEPYIVQAAPASEYQLKLVVPVLGIADGSPLKHVTATTAMDSRTLISIAFFALLQISVYMICLRKIASIDRQSISPLLKLRLMENEENLFDGGLYVGIGGTATALVLQVLNIIEPNLLAAYSSNLFGITCVALIKIGHVRPYKCKLIMDAQAVTVPVDNKPKS